MRFTKSAWVVLRLLQQNKQKNTYKGPKYNTNKNKGGQYNKQQKK